MSTAAQICLYIMLSLVINVVAYTIICQWREAVEENRKLRRTIKQLQYQIMTLKNFDKNGNYKQDV